MDNVLTDIELKMFFDGLFPKGFAGEDVLADIAPEGWHKSPLIACFHPTPEQVFEQSLRIHRNIQELIHTRDSGKPCAEDPEPTLDKIRVGWEETPIRVAEEVTELVGRCVWDIFSDNNKVIAADDRWVDIGSFRGAGAFIDGYISGKEDLHGNYMKFYLGSLWMRFYTDLRMVYAMIFRRIRSLDADWRYYFPQMHMIDLTPLREEIKPLTEYSPSEAFAAQQEDQQRQLEIEESLARVGDLNRQARQEAMDGSAPSTVLAYRQVYGRNPYGWPPVL